MSSRRFILSSAVVVSVLCASAGAVCAQSHAPLQLVGPQNTTLSCTALPPVAGSSTPDPQPTYICRPVVATFTAAAVPAASEPPSVPITTAADPLPARPGPTREKLEKPRAAGEGKSRTAAPLYIGAAIGAGIGAVGGGILGNLGHGLGGIDCESDCDYDSTDDTLGAALGGMVVGGLFGLGVGALVWAAGPSESADEPRTAGGPQRKPKAVSNLAPVLNISADGTGAYAGVSGAF